MPDNEEIVAQEPVSDEKQTSKPPEGVQPSAEERLAELIDQRIQKAVAAATEQAKRELQSAKDKARAEVEKAQRQARTAETIATTARSKLAETDPELAQALEVTELRTKLTEQEERERITEAQRAQQEFHSNFQSALKGVVEKLGIDPTDSRLDWAEDAPNYVEAMSRLLSSAADVNKANISDATKGFEERLAKLEKGEQTKENIERNSVETTTSTGSISASDKDFKEKFGLGELPVTQENIDRYNKLLNS